MHNKFILSLAVLVAFAAGLYAGSALTIKYYLPVYEAPMLAVNSMSLGIMDDCLERADDECFRLAFGLLIERESSRADAILEHGHGTEMDEEVRDYLLKLRELRKKYVPDA